MKQLAIWFGKRYALSVVRDMVAAKSGAVAKWSARVAVWAERAGLAVQFLQGVADRLADGELSEREAADTLQAAEALARQITGGGE
jgi:hypothetical protein